MTFAHQYLATVRDESQQITKRMVYAASQAKAVTKLQQEKCRVISIEARPNPTWEALKKGKLEIGSAANKRELATFSNNLALMGLARVKSAVIISSCTSMASVL
jgi:type II secretory pathway component PulF